MPDYNTISGYQDAPRKTIRKSPLKKVADIAQEVINPMSETKQNVLKKVGQFTPLGFMLGGFGKKKR